MPDDTGFDLIIPVSGGSGGAPSGPAGGSLALTYPNPSFAGRDSSVDKLNQDMLPAWLGGGAAGVFYTPALVLAETAADLDLRRKDLDPALMVPGNGITTFPSVDLDLRRKDLVPSLLVEGAAMTVFPDPRFNGLITRGQVVALVNGVFVP